MKELIDALKLLDKLDLLDSDEAEKIAAVLLLEQVKLTKLSPTLRTWFARKQAIKTARDALREHYQKGFKV